MSIDIEYCSFCPSRADKEWPNFKKDFFAIKESFSKSNQKKEKENKKKYEAKINNVRRDLLKKYEEEGFFVPEIDQEGDPTSDWTDEDKFEHIRAYGKLQSKTDGTEIVPYLRDTDLIEEFEDKIHKIYSESSLFSRAADDLSVEQKFLFENANLDYLLFEKNFDLKKLLELITSVDIAYGSLGSGYLENGKWEDDCREALASVFEMKQTENIPLKEEWVRTFTTMTPEKFEKAVQYVSRNNDDESREEARWIFLDYLKEIRPVMKELKELPEAVFFTQGTGGICPSKAEKMLEKRAKEIYEKYKGFDSKLWK
jgi:hypothetical protein